MITESTIYWITRMDYLQGLALVITITLSICCLIGVIISCIAKYSSNYEEERERGKKAFQQLLPFTLLCFVLLCGAMLIPSSKEYCAIKAIPVIVNNEQVQELPNKVVELANEWINELKPSKGSE